MEESRHTLLDISEAANKVTRKIAPQAASGDNPRPPRKPGQKQQ
jgi:phospholipid/cholesterol/gamma-HCH transport system substrate-binding protein